MYGFAPPDSKPCPERGRSKPRDEACMRGFTCVERGGRFIPVPDA